MKGTLENPKKKTVQLPSIVDFFSILQIFSLDYQGHFKTSSN